jgi:predicted amidohydrolase
MIVAALQTDIVWEDPEANFARLIPKLREAASVGAKLIVLPEMFAYGFSMNTAAIAEPPDGPSFQFLTKHARELGVWICGSAPERVTVDAERPANTLILAGPNGELHRYRKRHPFSFANEHTHYAAGDDDLTVEIDGLRVTTLICYDLRFANDFWALADRTDVFVVVANWPNRRREHWQTLLRARAIENQAWVVGLNRVGEGAGVEYTGDSMIIDPWGEVVTAASKDEAMLLANVDAERVREARSKFPVARDRRPRAE